MSRASLEIFRASVSIKAAAAAAHRQTGQPKIVRSSCLDWKATGCGLGPWARMGTTHLL